MNREKVFKFWPIIFIAFTIALVVPYVYADIQGCWVHGIAGLSTSPTNPNPSSSFTTNATTSYYVNVLFPGGGTVYYGSKHYVQKKWLGIYWGWDSAPWDNKSKTYPADTNTTQDLILQSYPYTWSSGGQTGEYRFRQESWISVDEEDTGSITKSSYHPFNIGSP